MSRPVPIITGTLAALLLLFGAYMGAYYSLLTTSMSGEVGDDYFYNDEYYHWHNPIVVTCFRPANQIDRIIRPSHWGIRPGD